MGGGAAASNSCALREGQAPAERVAGKLRLHRQRAAVQRAVRGCLRVAGPRLPWFEPSAGRRWAKNLAPVIQLAKSIVADRIRMSRCRRAVADDGSARGADKIRGGQQRRARIVEY